MEIARHRMLTFDLRIARQQAGGKPGSARGIEFGGDVRQEQDPIRRQLDRLGDAAVAVDLALGTDAGVEIAAEQAAQIAASL